PEGDFSPLWPVSQFHELEAHIVAGEEFSLIDPDVAFKPLLGRNYAVSTSSFAFTRSWWEKIGPFDERISTCVDLDLILRAVIAGPLVIVNDRIFEYRWDPSSLQRRSINKSSLESTIVRLRAASQKPEWATTQIEELRQSALYLCTKGIRTGELSSVRN